jgi:diacylglycerol kinase (ATP)
VDVTREYYVIFNPMASRGGATRSRAVIESTLKASGAKFLMVPTERRGHATELASRAVAEGWSAVVAVGGDGVVHEVANGLMKAAGDRPSIPFGIIPVGSGNDFIKMLGIKPHRPALAVQQMLVAKPRGVDIGRVSAHRMGSGPDDIWYFTNGVGVGFDAQVANHARGIQRLRGFAIYAWAVVKTLRDLRSPTIQVVVDGKEIANRPLVLTTVSNGPCHGGSFWLCPDARVDDGLLDVLVANARSLPAVMRLIPRVMYGKHLNDWGVELHLGKRIDVRSETPLPIHADGEIVAEWVRQMTIEVLPGKLTVLA